MSELDLGLEAFSKFVVALEPWLGEVVLVGGWGIACIGLIPAPESLTILR